MNHCDIFTIFSNVFAVIITINELLTQRLILDRTGFKFSHLNKKKKKKIQVNALFKKRSQF